MTPKRQLPMVTADSGLSSNALSKVSRVPSMEVHGLARGDRAVTIDTSGKLCEVLNLEPRPIGPKGR